MPTNDKTLKDFKESLSFSLRTGDPEDSRIIKNLKEENEELNKIPVAFAEFLLKKYLSEGKYWRKDGMMKLHTSAELFEVFIKQQ